jgi:hypothetical protein
VKQDKAELNRETWNLFKGNLTPRNARNQSQRNEGKTRAWTEGLTTPGSWLRALG